MTPTQPSQAVEAVVERLMKQINDYVGHRIGMETMPGHAELEAFERATDAVAASETALEDVLRAELARPQEVAAPVGITEEQITAGAMGLVGCHWDIADEEAKVHYRSQAKSVLLAASRVPVALPSEPDMRAICEALGFDPTNHHNAAKCPYCRPETPAPKQGDAKDARPDSFHSDSGDRDRVQAPGPTDAERLDWLERHFTEAGGNYTNDTGGITSFYIDCELDGSNLIRSTIDAAILASKATAAGEVK